MSDDTVADEPTIPASVPGPVLALDDAKALALANVQAGFPPPPQVQAVIDQAETEADARRAARAPAKPAPGAADTKE